MRIVVRVNAGVEDGTPAELHGVVGVEEFEARN